MYKLSREKDYSQHPTEARSVHKSALEKIKQR